MERRRQALCWPKQSRVKVWGQKLIGMPCCLTALKTIRKKAYEISHKPYFLMVRPERFELPTYRFVACCSIQLSYERPTTANIEKTGRVVKRFFEGGTFFYF